jgi:hypothetical protein
MKDETDNRTKVICVFDVNVSTEQMVEHIAKYLEKNEMNEDDEYAPISKEDCLEYAKQIVNGEIADFDLDRYWLEVDVPTLANYVF